MSFSVTLFDCADDPRTLKKTLEDGIPVLNIRPTGIVDLMNPTFELDYNASYTTKNYLIAGAPFNRNYFITDMRIDIGKKIYISCVVDVLATYRADISRISANVVRQENLIKEMLPDPNFVYINEHDVINILGTLGEGSNNVFGSNVEANCIVLGIAGDSNAYYLEIPGFTLLTEEPSDWAINKGGYWVNLSGKPTAESMMTIGQLINAGYVQVTASYNDIVGTYGGVYKKNRN